MVAKMPFLISALDDLGDGHAENARQVGDADDRRKLDGARLVRRGSLSRCGLARVARKPRAGRAGRHGTGLAVGRDASVAMVLAYDSPFLALSAPTGDVSSAPEPRQTPSGVSSCPPDSSVFNARGRRALRAACQHSSGAEIGAAARLLPDVDVTLPSGARTTRTTARLALVRRQATQSAGGCARGIRPRPLRAGRRRRATPFRARRPVLRCLARPLGRSRSRRRS